MLVLKALLFTHKVFCSNLAVSFWKLSPLFSTAFSQKSKVMMHKLDTTSN